jgi:hypothetical protein
MTTTVLFSLIKPLSAGVQMGLDNSETELLQIDLLQSAYQESPTQLLSLEDQGIFVLFSLTKPLSAGVQMGPDNSETEPLQIDLLQSVYQESQMLPLSLLQVFIPVRCIPIIP